MTAILAGTSGAPVEASRSSSTSPPRTIRVGLIGLGRIGRAFAAHAVEARDLLARRTGAIVEVVGALVRSARPTADVLPAGAITTTSFEEFLAARPDVVVEATAGGDAVATLLRAALGRGVAVVTANKALVAEHGPALARIARERGTTFRYEASVAAGVPVFHVLDGALRTAQIDRLAGILNATSNRIVSDVRRRGARIDAAVASAAAAGFCEPDPQDDLSGIDAARKLAILATRITARHTTPEAFEIDGIGDLVARDFALAALFGHTIRPVAVATITDGRATGWVAPALVAEGDPLAGIDGGQNAVVFASGGDGAAVRSDGARSSAATADARLVIAGPGAGGTATAEALLDDVLLAATRSATCDPLADAGAADAVVRPIIECATPWLLAFRVARSTPADDVVDFATACGLPFREVRRQQHQAGTTVVGITRPAPRSRVRAFRAAIAAIPSVSRVRSLRVVAHGEAS